jgi:hypothetical protein
MTDPSDLIAAHIAAHGVTRCPAAIVAPSTATLSAEDEQAHRSRTQTVPSDWNYGWQPPPERRKGNRR